MKTPKFFSLLFLLFALSIQGQDTTQTLSFEFKNLHPVAQVFGAAGYNFSQSRYDFVIGRAHLGFGYDFNNKWSAKIIIDRGRPASFNNIEVSDQEGNPLNVEWENAEGAYYTMFLKFASLKFKVNEQFSIEGGAILQNHYITQERFWGLRYVAQTFQDLYWRIPSTDLGFITYYKPNDLFSFDVALTNGEGPRLKQDEMGKIKLAGGININPWGIVVTRLYYHYRQKHDQDHNDVEQMGSAFIGIKPIKELRIGSEFNYMNNFEGMSGLDSYGFSVFTVWELNKGIALFARFDRILYILPEEFESSSFTNGNLYMAGISYTPVKGVCLSLNMQNKIPDQAAEDENLIMNLSMAYKL